MQLIFVDFSYILQSTGRLLFFGLLYFAILFVDFPEYMNNSVMNTLAKKQVQSEYNSILSLHYLQKFLAPEQNLTVCLIMSLVSIQFSSVAQSCLTLCDPMNCSMPGLPVHHQLLEFTQTHVH